MSRFYNIVRLRAGQTITIDENLVSVDLTKITVEDIIENDDQFNKSLDLDNYFFVSGGGSFLLNDRYLLTVRRPLSARVNPGKMSLFTGRAEGPDEWCQPWRVVRELFEEIVLFYDSKVLYPRFTPYQEVIDEVYKNNFNHLQLATTDFVDLKLKKLPLFNYVLRVIDGKQISEAQYFLHINYNNDINLLSLFSFDIDLDYFSAKDAEEISSIREVFLLDTESESIKEICSSSDGKFHPMQRTDMTEHLCSLLDGLLDLKKTTM